MVDVEKSTVYFPKGLGRPHHEGEAPVETGYQVLSLERMVTCVDAGDRDRFRLWIDGLLASSEDTRVVELLWHASWGADIHLRLAGRMTGSGGEARIVGLVEVLSRWKESERLARSLSFIIEALFISTEDGIIIFDNRLRVRRLNRHAMELFGITEADEERGDWAEVIEAKLPRSTREQLLEAVENSVAVSGILAPAGFAGPRLAWRANPWGTGDGDMSGIVMLVAAKRPTRSAVHSEIAAAIGVQPAAAAPSPAPGQSAVVPPAPSAAAQAAVRQDPSPISGGVARDHRALEWVKHPILLVSIDTAEIVYANRAARELFRLDGDRRSYAENVYDVSGFPSDPDPLSVAAAGHRLVHLKMGARVGRMFDYDDRLLFVEYHGELPRARNPAVVASHGSR
jgi:PAS domain-containing protein